MKPDRQTHCWEMNLKKKIIQPRLTCQTHDPNNKIDNFIESKRKKKLWRLIPNQSNIKL